MEPRLSGRPVAESAAPAPSASPPRLSQPGAPGLQQAAPPTDDDAQAALLQQATAALQAGRPEAALALLERAAARPGQPAARRADIGFRIGRVQLRLQRPDRALQAFDRSLRAIAELDPRLADRLRPLALHGQAEALRAQGRPGEARQAYERAGQIDAARGDAGGQARAWAEMGSTWMDEADFSAALSHYERARALRLADGSPALGDGRLLVNMSSLYTWMGRYDDALALQAQALALCSAQQDAHCLATTAQAEGFTRHQMGDYPGAAAAAARAVEALGPAPTIDRARALNNLGLSLVEAGRLAEGVAALQAAQALAGQVGDRRDRATVADSLGTAYRLGGDAAQAEAHYRQALLLWRQTRHIEGQRDTWANLGRLAAGRGQVDRAILHLKAAVNLAQQLRRNTRDMSADLRAGLTQRLEPTYTLLAGLLTDRGRLAEARVVTAMLKEHELYELVRGDAQADPRTARAPFTGLEAQLQQEDDALAARLATAAEALDALERRAAGAGLDAAGRARRSQLEAELAAGAEAFERYLSRLEPLFARLDEASRRDAEQLNLAAAVALQKSLRTLGPGVVLLHYVVLDDQLKIILTSSHTQRGYSVAVGRTDLNRAIGELRRGIDRRADVQPAARRLYDLLIAPVQADLQALGARTLMLALTGTLRYLPFAALHDGRRWLAEHYALALYTEAARQNIEAAAITPWRLQAFGVARKIEGFSQLTAVQAEIDGIVEPGGLPGRKRMDGDFTAETFRDAIDARPPVLHVASHFVFRPGTEVDSFLLLGDGSRLTLADFKRLRFTDLDLITLSACETALGGGLNENGREIEGLAAMAQKRGANAVLATLWPVADHSTAQLMQRFYLLRQSSPALSKAEALRTAQREMLGADAGKASAGTSRQAPGAERAGAPSPPAVGAAAALATTHGLAAARGAEVETAESPAGAASAPPARAAQAAPFAHPYYWAPFVLMGNWR